MKNKSNIVMIIVVCLFFIFILKGSNGSDEQSVGTNVNTSNEDGWKKTAGNTTGNDWLTMTTFQKADIVSGVIGTWEKNGEDVVKSKHWFVNNLNDFYDKDTFDINLSKAMSMIAVTGGAFKEDADRIEKATSKLSDREEEIWQYCMDRWEYYDDLEGGYSGDKYTEEVFKDASNEFGITASEAENTWSTVDRAKLGAS